MSVAFLAVCGVAGGRAWAAEGGDGGEPVPLLMARLAELQKQLEGVDADLKEAVAAAAAANKRYFQFEHDIVYTNAPAKVVYLEIKALEKQLVDKRQELKEIVMKLPEMRELIKERQDVFERQRVLRERQRILQGEIGDLKQKVTKF